MPQTFQNEHHGGRRADHAEFSDTPACRLTFPVRRLSDLRAGRTGATLAGGTASPRHQPLFTTSIHSRDGGATRRSIEANRAAHLQAERNREGMAIFIVVVSAFLTFGLMGFILTKAIANHAAFNINPTHFCGAC